MPNRYPYSTKIICEEHGTTFHRQVLKSAQGDKEFWQCKVYRLKGKKSCSAPQIRSSELDEILSKIFTEMMKDKRGIIDSIITVLTNVPKEVDYERMLAAVESEISGIQTKKDRLFDLHIAGAITIEEFKTRNDALNEKLKEHESALARIRQAQAKVSTQELGLDAIRRELDRGLSFADGVNSALVATILDKVIVKKESTPEEIHLDIYLKLGQKYEAIYSPQGLPASINSPRSVDAHGNIFWECKDSLEYIVNHKKGGFSGQECCAFLKAAISWTDKKIPKFITTPPGEEFIPTGRCFCRPLDFQPVMGTGLFNSAISWIS